jgi:hypothetical protein
LKPRHYLILVILLWLHLLIRSHQITELPIFVDEGNHIKRAAQVHHLENHPAQNSQGKFLLYLWLAAPDLRDSHSAMHLGRTWVALGSLLTSALIWRVVARWSDPAYGLLAVALYALLPYAFFYERMALADPWAGTWGMVTLWAAMRLAQKPTRGRAGWVGAAAALTVMAKLTLSLAVLFPALALWLLIPGRLAGFRTATAWLRAYLPLLIWAGVVFTVLWSPVLIPARLSYMNETREDDFIIANSEWVAGEEGTPLLTKVGETWTKYAQLASWPLALLSLGLVAAGVYLQPRRMGFLLGALALAWLPSILLVLNLQTRYLMSGLPILVCAIALGGFYSLGRYRWALPSLSLALALWAGLFALPFAQRLSSDPPSLSVPPLDARNYFWDQYNAYANREALAWLAEQAPDALVFPMTPICRHLDLEAPTTLQLICLDNQFLGPLAEVEWQPALDPYLTQGQTVYILTSRQADVPPTVTGITWELLATFPKPLGDQTVLLWAVRMD